MARAISQELRQIRLAKEAFQQEEIEWNKVRNLDTELNFEDYLENFPNGIHVPLAKRRLEELRKLRQEHTEKTAWEMAKEQHTEKAYKDYLRLYPDGNYYNEAFLLLEKQLWQNQKTKQPTPPHAFPSTLEQNPKITYGKQPKSKSSSTDSKKLQATSKTTDTNTGSTSKWSKIIFDYALQLAAVIAILMIITWLLWRFKLN
ncbi:MAG: hypothetical protein IPM82_07345 [Saprospiraceae bacterium]|nr:hypothetical protein [Saprospiraceae bacterium]